MKTAKKTTFRAKMRKTMPGHFQLFYEDQL